MFQHLLLSNTIIHFFLLLFLFQSAPSLSLSVPPIEDMEEFDTFEDLPKFEFKLANWRGEDETDNSILLSIVQSTSEANENDVNYRLETEPGTIILNRSKRGLKRKNQLKRRRVARHKSRSNNFTKQLSRSSNRNGIAKGNNIHLALQNHHTISLSNRVLHGIRGSKKLRQVSLEIFIHSEKRTTSVSSRRTQDRIKILPFLIHRQRNNKVMVVARGQYRDTRQSQTPKFGANHSGRTRASASIRRYEFIITHLVQKIPRQTINLTEMPMDSSGLLSWIYPEIQLSIICVRKNQIVSCPQKGIHVKDSPRFLFHTYP